LPGSPGSTLFFFINQNKIVLIKKKKSTSYIQIFYRVFSSQPARSARSHRVVTSPIFFKPDPIPTPGRVGFQNYVSLYKAQSLPPSLVTSFLVKMNKEIHSSRWPFVLWKLTKYICYHPILFFPLSFILKIVTITIACYFLFCKNEQGNT
jgi:hypothetical protein